MNDSNTKLNSIDEISAGNFSVWLDKTIQIQKTGEAADVPCGGCTACCTSSYFIHIEPHETKTLSKIPKELMFPAPGLPKGNVLLGFNENGCCPMFVDNKCSIYDYRPQTCRFYDCRIFTATGLHTGDDRVLILRQVRRWKFNCNDKRDIRNLSAVRCAAKFINEHAGSFPKGFIPANTPQRAMIALKIYKIFLNMLDDEKDSQLNSDDEIIKAVIDIYEESLKDEDI